MEGDFLDGVSGDVQLVSVGPTSGRSQLGGVVPEGVVDVVDGLKIGVADQDVPRRGRALSYLLFWSGNAGRKCRIKIQLGPITQNILVAVIPKR